MFKIKYYKIMSMNQLEKELVEFLKYIKEVHTDSYGHLEICDIGDEFDPTVENIVKNYITNKIKYNLLEPKDFKI
jgi:hypothetical protein